MIKNLIAKVTGKKQAYAEFGEYPIILHVGYHKCLTVYVNKILKKLSEEFNFLHRQFRSYHEDKIEDFLEARTPGVYFPKNNPYLDLSNIGPYKGSHFIRNPRDLIVSGYKYHLWTDEDWCIRKNYNWKRITELDAFKKYIESDEALFPQQGQSYQEYLNSLDKTRGMTLEILRNFGSITHMNKWDYHQPEFIEFKYEDIIGNEGSVFQRIFEHYGFKPAIVKRGVELAEEYSLKNIKKSENSHVQDGSLEQWRKHMEPEHIQIFDELYPGVMDRLGYPS